ncbi:TetR/AcrR family transcriptional regulator [Neptuniibacter sp. 1_MG-2023]|uniref:TetR/AcrR family transcriptional regulator n=1 Tax=Neptuniibacter sp. 1_MG-2023 TaxID=3062662 RepID=UPI0026E3BD19|nr:TetR/AcrR family transcriptional regulator [Neptuniibacter sp. 1_MG-2023]MDO6592652.1 TetR/AcrR family transcriptional regulator [Neptuniibacter sp. 1_MG-2023]
MARPAEFDRTDVLEKAMGVFWRTGYNASSITDLVKATQLKPGSLYGAFQSKRGLFMEALDTYSKRSIERIAAVLSKSESPLKNIESFFIIFCEELEKDQIGKGCFMINTMLELATEDDEIRERVSLYLDQVEQSFCDTISKAQQLGEIDPHKNAQDLATYLMTNIWGLRVLSSKRPNHKKYEAVISNILLTLTHSHH